ncbi:MFS general substrate transporter [Pisolithus marmoratus]|nr:MFS general substrate transporter [Pisolithus marmoratus]
MLDKNGVTFCSTAVLNVQERAQIHLGPEQERKLWRKVDLRLLPMVFFMSLLSFMDRGECSCNAKLEGLMTQLHLTGSQFNVALVSQIMTNTQHTLLRKLNIVRILCSGWLPGIMFAWGTTMMLMGFVRSYPQLVAMRFLLGMAEAGFHPGVIFYLSMWYPTYKLIYRIALFGSAVAAAGAVSGLLAYAIGFMNTVGHFEGWSWVFIIQGLATIVVCLVAAFVLVDYPNTAKFLNAEEKQFIEQQRSTYVFISLCVSHGSIPAIDIEDGGEGSVSQRILTAITDWQVWAMAFLLMLWDAPAHGITLFLPTIMNNFGYDVPISQLLTVPVYVAATISMISVAHFSDTMKIRFPFIIAAEFVGLVGYIIQITDASTGVKCFGTYLVVIGVHTGIPCTIGWQVILFALANNLRGKYKRAAGMAIQIGMSNFGGIVASNIFRTQDDPRYTLGFAIEIGFLCTGLIVAVFSAYAYHRANTARIARAMRDEMNEAKRVVDLYVI